jgi:BirA family biotin operon repressor/biotin-[acetyl-CoA-carboxylase] ligase
MLPQAHLAFSERLGRPCWYFERTDSTNERAFELACAGAPHGSVVLADAQSAGRGRLGRSWFSPPGHNLYFTMVLRPRTPPAETSLITLAAGVAVAEVLGLRAKWPNDVVDGRMRKVAGLLAELELEQGQVAFVLMGVGLNVNQPDFPPDLPQAASLRMLRGQALDRHALLAELLPALDRRTEQIHHERPALIEAWTALSASCGRRVRVGDLEGVALGLAEDGALLIRDDRDRLHSIVAGDVLPAET